jgi:hypothetical protein
MQEKYLSYKLFNKLSNALLCLPPASTPVSCSVYSSTLKMEVIYASETSVEFQRIVWCYISEDGTLHRDLSKEASLHSF